MDGRSSPAREADAERSVPRSDDRPAALVDGQAVPWSELRPVLVERAGAEALAEIVLDRRLRAELDRVGMSITTEEVERERRLLLEALSSDPNDALRLLAELRTRDGLADVRFGAMLWRNAAMRALVRDRVTVTAEAIAQAHELHHGERRQVRILTVDSIREAEAAARRIRDGERFADVAVDTSTDASAARGGLLEPLSPADPAYPRALRDAMRALAIGEVSPPILLDRGYAIIEFQRITPGDGTPLADVRQVLERSVRLQQERLLMDRLARRLLDEATVSVLDDALNERWQRR